MARFRCPSHARNKEQHDQLINALAHFNHEYEIHGPLKDMLQRLHTTLVWWINSHILKIDVQLKGCVQPKGTSGELSPPGGMIPPVT